MTDRFMNDQECIDRLLGEYAIHGNLIVCYDFDNTIFDYHKRGDRFELVIALIRQVKKLGCTVIVFTSCDESRFPDIRQYLKENDIPCDGINENAKSITFTGRKLYFNILLDDRAGLGSAYRQLKEVAELIELNRNADRIKSKQDIDH